MNERDSAIDLLKKKIDEVELLKGKRDHAKLVQWQTEVNMILDKLVGDQSKYFHLFNEVQFTPRIFTSTTSPEHFQKVFDAGLEESKGILNSIVFGIEQNLL